VRNGRTEDITPRWRCGWNPSNQDRAGRCTRLGDVGFMNRNGASARRSALSYHRSHGLRREPCGSHTRTDRQRIRSDGEKDVRRTRVPDPRQHGRSSKRPGWGIGSRRPSAVRCARRNDERSPHGDARAADAGMATSRPRRPSHETPARQVGEAWHGVRPLASREAIDRHAEGWWRRHRRQANRHPHHAPRSQPHQRPSQHPGRRHRQGLQGVVGKGRRVPHRAKGPRTPAPRLRPRPDGHLIEVGQTTGILS
jgi:hypothetical protein